MKILLLSNSNIRQEGCLRKGGRSHFFKSKGLDEIKKRRVRKQIAKI